MAGDTDDLAARFLEADDRGAGPDLAEWAGALTTQGARDAFLQAVADARRARDLLGTHAPGDPWPAGTVLEGRYVVTRPLGRGGMGRVYEAHDGELDRLVAIKLVPAQGRKVGFRADERLDQECRALAALQHPGIVAVHALGRSPAGPYLVMDRVQGCPLDTVLETLRDEHGDRPPGRGEALALATGLARPAGSRTSAAGSWWRAVARFTADLARALEAAHATGVLHRDLKPSNILVRGDGSPVLVDFGLASHLQSGAGEVTRGLVGSPPYLSPEQLDEGAIGLDPRTDVYQLGAVLFELLTLTRAFRDEDGAMLERIRKGQVDLPRRRNPDVPEDLQAICLRAMAACPGERYPDVRGLRVDLERVLGGRRLPDAVAGVASPALVLRYVVRRHRTTFALVGALLVALGAWAWGTASGAAPLARLEPWRYGGEPLHPVASGTSAPARPGEVLGVHVLATVPVHIYAVSVFGHGDLPDRLLPMHPVALEAQLPTRAPWGLAVESGDPGLHVGLTRVDVPAHDDAREGLWVFTSREPLPHLDAWLDALAREAELVELEGTGVRRDRALELFRVTADVERGELLPAGTRLATTLPPDDVFGDGLHRESGFERHSWSYRVAMTAEEPDLDG